MLLRLVYNPEGGQRQQFAFNPDTALSLEAEPLEAAGGDIWDTYPGFLMKIGTGNIRARRALLWVMLRRSNPKLRFEDVVFHLGEFSIEDADDDEPEGQDEPDATATDSPSPDPVIDAHGGDA